MLRSAWLNIATVLILTAMLGACSSAPPPKPDEAHKKLAPTERVDQVTDLFHMINTGDFDRIMTTVNDNVELYNVGGLKETGKGAARGSFEIKSTSFPGYQQTPKVVIESDIAVIVEYVFHGTQKGPFMDVAPLGKSFAVNGLSIFQFIDSQIGAMKGYQDTSSVIGQLREPQTVMPAQVPGGQPYTVPRGNDEGMTDRVKAWVATLTTDNLHPTPDFYTEDATFRLMLKGAEADKEQPLLQVLAQLRDEAPNLKFDNVWVYPAEEHAVVTMLASGLAANPALGLQTATERRPRDIVMVLEFKNGRLHQVRAYLNRNLTVK